MNKPILYVMVGLSASGKSTIAEQIASEQNCKIVSSDHIRGEICEAGVIDQSKKDEVFKLFHKRIREYLINGENVIADATHVSMKARRRLLENVKNIDCYKIAYIVPKSIEKCIKDNIYKEYPVPHHVIKRQMMNFQVPFVEEGFDEIDMHQFEKEYNLSILDIILKMDGFDQKNLHHTMTLYGHCIYTAYLFSYLYKNEYVYAANIHDVGKLFTQKIDDDGIAHYYQHENVGSYYLLSNFNNLGMKKQEILNMCFLINYHMMPMSWNSEKARQKWKIRFGEYKYKMLIYFNLCDKAR